MVQCKENKAVACPCYIEETSEAYQSVERIVTYQLEICVNAQVWKRTVKEKGTSPKE